MCKVAEVGEAILPMLEQSIEREKELAKKLEEYHEKLINIDHEMQIKTLKAGHLAKVMKYRQNILMERRSIKDEWVRIKEFNRLAQVKGYLGHFKAAIRRSHELYEMQHAEGYIKDTGVVDMILSS